MSKPREHYHLLGHVDKADGDAITGWLANADEPDRLEAVICEDASGRSVAFHAWHVREDVCRWLNRSGRFGFVIPVEALRGLGDVLTIRDRQGKVLPNGASVRLDRATRSDHGDTATIFLHIPKTAGTSVSRAIVAGLLPSDRLFLYPGVFGLTTQELAALPIAQRRAARLVIGHTYFGIDRFLGKAARYVTFLREPMARLRSHAAHHARAQTGFRHDGAGIDLATVVNDALDEEFDNLMVRSIAGLRADVVPLGAISESDVELALFNIERHFAMVGLVETIETDGPRLAELLGRPIERLPIENTSIGGGSACGIDWERVRHRNRFDQMLYDRVAASRRVGRAVRHAGRVHEDCRG